MFNVATGAFEGERFQRHYFLNHCCNKKRYDSGLAKGENGPYEKFLSRCLLGIRPRTVKWQTKSILFLFVNFSHVYLTMHVVVLQFGNFSHILKFLVLKILLNAFEFRANIISSRRDSSILAN